MELNDVQLAVKLTLTNALLNCWHLMTAAAINSWCKAFKDAGVPHPGDKEVAE